MKQMLLDVILYGRFVCQVTFCYCPLWPFDLADIEACVVEKRPSLNGKPFKVEFSNNRV